MKRQKYKMNIFTNFDINYNSLNREKETWGSSPNPYNGYMYGDPPWKRATDSAYSYDKNKGKTQVHEKMKLVIYANLKSRHTNINCEPQPVFTFILFTVSSAGSSR